MVSWRIGVWVLQVHLWINNFFIYLAQLFYQLFSKIRVFYPKNGAKMNEQPCIDPFGRSQKVRTCRSLSLI